MKELKDAIMNDPYYLNYLSEEDIQYAYIKLEDFLKKKKIEKTSIHKSLKVEVALMIKQISKNHSCRSLAELLFNENDPRFGLQMDGRDVKRWASVVIGDLFDPESLVDGEYYHEY